MFDYNDTPATVAHLPGIYHEPATELADHAGPLPILLRLYERVIGDISAAIDDGATYLDPLTAPTLVPTGPAPPTTPHSGVPHPMGTATLKAALTKATSKLKSEDYPADQKGHLEEVIRESGVRLLELGNHRTTADKLLGSAWKQVTAIVASHDPRLATAALLAQRAGLSPRAAVATMRTLFVRCTEPPLSSGVVTDRAAARGVAIANAEDVLARIDRELAELDKSWSLMPALRFFIPASDARPDADFLAWLGTWVGIDVTEVEPPLPDVNNETRRRELVQAAAVLWRHRGTPAGLKAILEAAYDIQVDVHEWWWPKGMRIEQSSTIGINTALLPDADLNHSFVVVWAVPPDLAASMGASESLLPLRHQDGQSARGWLRVMDVTKGEGALVDAFRTKVQKIRRAIERERPAHTSWFLAFGAEEVIESTEPVEMQIGLHSKIGACVLPEPKG